MYLNLLNARRSRNITLLILEAIKEVFLVELTLEVAFSSEMGSITLNYDVGYASYPGQSSDLLNEDICS